MTNQKTMMPAPLFLLLGLFLLSATSAICQHSNKPKTKVLLDTDANNELDDQHAMAAVAIVKNPEWAERKMVPAPILENGKWKERPDNNRKIVVCENFDKEAIMKDFFDRMGNYVLPAL